MAIADGSSGGEVWALDAVRMALSGGCGSGMVFCQLYAPENRPLLRR